VAEAMNGHDGVISCLGGPGTKPSTLITEMTKNIIQAMKATGVTRIVQVSSAGVHGELKGITGKIVSTILKNPLKDHLGAYEELRESGLDYTLARPMSLADGPRTQQYREVTEGVPTNARKIVRADVAHFLVKAIQDPSYIHKSIGLAE
ncbi:MAG: NAD(P)-dependent oxidoreductase, partial [Culicoidibacterales bacterium]